jgi:selenocysteine lyase/cysteine desulfurase
MNIKPPASSQVKRLSHSVEAIRRDQFKIFESRAYLNSCSQGALANDVRAAYDTYLDQLEEFGSLWETWVGVQEDVRGQIATLFSTQSDQVAVTTSASAAMNAIASCFDFRNGPNKVLTTSLEFPTVGQIWHAQERNGAEIVHVRADPDHRLPAERIAAAIDGNTAIVSITHVCYRNGAMNDIKAIVDAAHERGVPVLVDAYQSTGAVPIDFDDLGADFLLGGVLKYMLGSPGIGFALVNDKSLSELIPATFIPTATGWFAARDIFSMDIYNYDPAKDARRFEAGTPNVPSLYAAQAGLKFLLEVGVNNAYDVSSQLHDQLRAGVNELGGVCATPEHPGEHGPMLAVASLDEHALVNAMARENVVVSSRDGNIRISPHFYNNGHDIELALAAIAKNRHLLATP